MEDQTARIPSNRGNRGTLALLVITLAALGLRLWGLGFESLSMDELRQVRYYERPVSLLVLAACEQNQPPLDYLIGGLLHRIGLAQHDIWVRVPALVFGVGGVFLIGWITRSIAGTTAGLIAAALLAVSPLHVAMSQEARPYTIFFFFVLATLLALARARTRNTAPTWAAFGLLFLLMLMTRTIGPHVIAIAFAIHAAACWVARRKTSKSVRLQETRKCWAFATTTAMAYAVYNPLVGIIYFQTRGYMSARPDGSWLDRTRDMLSQSLEHLAPSLTTLTGPGLLSGIIAGVLLVLGLWNLVTSRYVRSEIGNLFAVTMVSFPIVYALLYTRSSTFPAKPQYLLPMGALLVAVVGIGAASLIHFTRRRPAYSHVAAFLLVSSVGLPMLQDTADAIQHKDKTDWRGLLAYLNENARSDDAIFSLRPGYAHSHRRPHLHGAWRYLSLDTEIVPISLETDPSLLEAEPYSDTQRHVWLVVNADWSHRIPDRLVTANYTAVRAIAFGRLCLIELPPGKPANYRLMQGIRAVTSTAPQSSRLVAANLLGARFFAARNQPLKAERWFRSAVSHCATDQERQFLRDVSQTLERITLGTELP